MDLECDTDAELPRQCDDIRIVKLEFRERTDFKRYEAGQVPHAAQLLGNWTKGLRAAAEAHLDF